MVWEKSKRLFYCNFSGFNSIIFTIEDNTYGEADDKMEDSEECPSCGREIFLDEEIEWIDRAEGIFRCPECGGTVEIKP